MGIDPVPNTTPIVEDAGKGISMFPNFIWANWFFNLRDQLLTKYLHKDITSNVTVGYTTDIEAVTIASGTLTPVITLEHMKTLAVTGSFTLGVPGPTGLNGFCEFRVTVTGGTWTITKGTNVELVGTDVTLVAGTKYVLNIRKYSDTDCVAQLNATG